jgi:acetyl-CoA C-acetyltransferase
MMQRLRAAPGQYGLVTANGNYVTKHSAGVYSTDMPKTAFMPEDPATYQAQLDSIPKPAFSALASGAASVETYTVFHDRDGPAGGIVIGRTSNGTRFMANTPNDPGLLEDIESREFIGAVGTVSNDGTRNVFVP